MSRAKPKTPRRRVTLRLHVTGEERKYVARLLVHIRRSSGFVAAIKKLLREPATTPRKERQ